MNYNKQLTNNNLKFTLGSHKLKQLAYNFELRTFSWQLTNKLNTRDYDLNFCKFQLTICNLQLATYRKGTGKPVKMTIPKICAVCMALHASERLKFFIQLTS